VSASQRDLSRALMVAALFLPMCLEAQESTPPSPFDLSSPLRPLGDLVHELPAPPRFPSILADPRPRPGLHWTGGNPAGLAFELTRARQEIRLGLADVHGDYRRPLDPGRSGSLGFDASAWEPLDDVAGLVGRIAASRSSLDEIFANTALAYTSSPHVLLDTSGVALGQSAARIEGAGGWRLGGWGAGLALGYETMDTRTEDATVARAIRLTRPAVSAGLARDVGPARVGVHVRWQGLSQTATLTPRRGVGLLRVYLVEGLAAPRMTETDIGFFNRDTHRDARAVGVSAAGVQGSVAWAAFAESATLREEQSTRMENEPPLDSWDTSGGVAGVAASSNVRGDQLQLFLQARYQWLAGEGRRADLPEEDLLFQADESRLSTVADIRYFPAPGWTTALRLSVDRTRRDRQDHLVRLDFGLTTWTAGGAIEVARELGGGLALAGAASAARYTPVGGVPDPDVSPPALRRYVSPALILEATPADALGASLTARWRPGDRGDFWLRGRYETASPRDASPRPPLAPEGSRSGWAVELGVMRR
jgi:hypothetical protein